MTVAYNNPPSVILIDRTSHAATLVRYALSTTIAAHDQVFGQSVEGRFALIDPLSVMPGGAVNPTSIAFPYPALAIAGTASGFRIYGQDMANRTIEELDVDATGTALGAVAAGDTIVADGSLLGPAATSRGNGTTYAVVHGPNSAQLMRTVQECTP